MRIKTVLPEMLSSRSQTPLKHWDRGFEPHMRHGCVCVYSVYVLSCVQEAALRRADPLSKEFYRLRKKYQETEKAAKAQRRAVDP
jgi:hypothetical protein